LIWLVDDTPLETDAARRTLEPAFEVRSFLDGSVALEELANGAMRPDLLILDWHMPGISGIEICQYLRSNSETQALPILMLTSNDQTEDVVRALSSGADDYVRKPHQPAELIARVATLLRAHRFLLRAERAERAIRSLLTQLPDAVLAVDASGRVAFANAEAERVFAGRQRRAALVGEDLRRLLPTLEPSLLSMAGGEALGEVRDVSMGDQIYAPSIGRVHLDDATMATITLRNVTAKHSEESRRLDFYSIIAHDLRSPLNAMSMRTHLLIDGARGPVSDVVRGELRKIGERIKGLAIIINDFLDLARLEAKSIIIDAAATDLRALLDESIEILGPLAEAKNLRIQISEPATPFLVRVDRRRIGQVVSNLLSNAIKFSSVGGAIVISMTHVPQGLEVAFKDSGPGIAPLALPLLFQRYARVPGSNVAGTGLGLMIVREVIEAHGGSVDVKSELGHGSRFSFMLPRALAWGEA
jgi:two-component system phosphate regulon sensor histidine kinase PhoR